MAQVIADTGPAPQLPVSTESGWRRGCSAAVIKTTRPLSSLVAGTLAASAAFSGQGGLTLRSMAAGSAMTTLTMFGFVVNDLADYYKDRAAGIRRPIAAGELSRKHAVWLAAALLLSAYLLSAAAGAGGTILAITSAALLLYSPLALRYPPIKDLYVAGLCCAPLYYGAVVGGRRYAWFLYVLLACFVLGREVLMDADELPGDTRAGVRTMAAVLGGRRTARIGATLMLLSAAVLVAVVRGRIETLAAIGALVCLACVFAWPGLEGSRRIHLSRFPMLVGCMALAFGGT